MSYDDLDWLTFTSPPKLYPIARGAAKFAAADFPLERAINDLPAVTVRRM